jgi:hypothetical protein
MLVGVWFGFMGSSFVWDGSGNRVGWFVSLWQIIVMMIYLRKTVCSLTDSN